MSEKLNYNRFHDPVHVPDETKEKQLKEGKGVRWIATDKDGKNFRRKQALYGAEPVKDERGNDISTGDLVLCSVPKKASDEYYKACQDEADEKTRRVAESYQAEQERLTGRVPKIRSQVSRTKESRPADVVMRNNANKRYFVMGGK